LNQGIKRIEQSIVSSRKIGEYGLLLGANYDNNLYVGAGIGIVTSRVDYTLRYQEFNESNSPDQPSTIFDRFRYTEELTSRNVGANFKLGIIYRALDFLRLGASFQTPTLYRVNEEVATDMVAYFKDGRLETASFVPLETTSNLSTPFLATGSLAFSISKNRINICRLSICRLSERKSSFKRV
jgi:long-subunit fatty acid transport protein